MLVQLKNCVVCGSDFKRGHSGDRCLISSNLFKHERSRGHLFGLRWARVRRVARGTCFGVMYCEWYGLCDFLVLSVVEVCADYGGVPLLISAPKSTVTLFTPDPMLATPALKRYSAHRMKH